MGVNCLVAELVAVPVPSIVGRLIRSNCRLLITGEDFTLFLRLPFRLFCLLFLLVRQFAISSCLGRPFQILQGVPNVVANDALNSMALTIRRIFVVLPLTVLMSTVHPSHDEVSSVTPILKATRRVIMVLRVLLSRDDVLAKVVRDLHRLYRNVVVVNVFRNAKDLLINVGNFLCRVLRQGVTVVRVQPSNASTLSVPVVLHRVEDERDVRARSLMDLNYVGVTGTLSVHVNGDHAHVVTGRHYYVAIPT